MIIDVKIKNYYLKFIYDTKHDIDVYKEELEKVKILKEELINDLENCSEILLKEFNVNLNDYEEWNTKTHNKEHKLYNKAIKLITNVDNEHINRNVILIFYKFTNILRKENYYKKNIELANKRSKLEFKEYKQYLQDYYVKLHKALLEGYGYEFKDGLGEFAICRFVSGKDENVLDFNATRENKKRLLEAGIKLFNKEDADYYKSKGLPYDGVDYRVYKNSSHYYEIGFTKSKILGKLIDFNRTEYVNLHYRGMSYKDMADKLCETFDDICNLKVDIRYKLNIFLYKNPTKYLNFIRNENESKYKYRTYYRKD